MTAHINITFDTLEPNQARAFAALFTSLASAEDATPHIDVREKDAVRRPSVFAAAAVPGATSASADEVKAEATASEIIPVALDESSNPTVGIELTPTPEEAPKAKRGRKPKEETAKQVTLDEAIAEAVAIPASEPASNNEAPSLDQLRDALNTYIAAHGTPAAVNLLADFGAERVSEVAKQPLDQQREFLKLCAK